MRKNLTQPIEDYLKTIYQLSQEHGRASTNQIAEVLEVTPASVTGMLKKLAGTNPPLVEYRKHHGVVLTPSGEQIALEVVRHHRLLEMYLYQVLGFEWDQVHTEADRLEHYISEELEERIAQMLGDPALDPHGDPIPTRDLAMPARSDRPLSSLRPGEVAVIQRVPNQNPDLLRYLRELQIFPQAKVHVVDYSPYDENLWLQVEGRQELVILGSVISSQIFVERLTE